MLYTIKRTIVNFYNENKKLVYILGGAILLPLSLALVVGLVFLLGTILVFLGLDTYQAITVMLLMGMGAIMGYLAYYKVNND